MQTINSAIRWWAQSIPNQVALSIGGESLTWATLNGWSERVAAHLLLKGGQPGDRVAICAPNSVSYWALVIGVIRAGCIAAPLHVRCTAHELAERVADYSPVIIFAGTEQGDRFAGCGVEVADIAELAGLPEAGALPDDSQPGTPVMIIMTSGSTAKPRGVLLTHQSMVAFSAGWALQEPGFAQGARIIGSGLASTAAGFVKVIQYLVAGATFYFEAEFDAEHFLDLMVRERITTFTGVPVFFERLAACPGFGEADLSHIETATTGGAHVARAVQEKWAAKGVVVRQGYGQTECGGIVTLMSRELAGEFPEKCGRGSIFTEVMTVDQRGERCAAGQPGQILVRGPSTMLGYWAAEQATAETIRDGWVHTGDIGVLDAEGYLTFVARMKDIIISGGLNISCAEVEQVIGTYEGVAEVAVIGVADDRFGETPLAVIYSDREVSVDRLIEHCNGMLADYKVPRYIVVEFEPLPRLPIGKLAKHLIREKYQDAAKDLPRVR